MATTSIFKLPQRDYKQVLLIGSKRQSDKVHKFIKKILKSNIKFILEISLFKKNK